MIYLCSIKINGGDVKYFYLDNYIYVILIYDDSIKYGKQAVDISTNMLVPNTIEWLLESEFPIYEHNYEIIYVDDPEGLFNILTKIIFEKL